MKAFYFVVALALACQTPAHGQGLLDGLLGGGGGLLNGLGGGLLGGSANAGANVGASAGTSGLLGGLTGGLLGGANAGANVGASAGTSGLLGGLTGTVNGLPVVGGLLSGLTAPSGLVNGLLGTVDKLVKSLPVVGGILGSLDLSNLLPNLLNTVDCLADTLLGKLPVVNLLKNLPLLGSLATANTNLQLDVNNPLTLLAAQAAVELLQNLTNVPVQISSILSAQLQIQGLRSYAELVAKVQTVVGGATVAQTCRIKLLLNLPSFALVSNVCQADASASLLGR